MPSCFRGTGSPITSVGGALSFLLTLGVVAFAVTVVVMRRRSLFEAALWSLVGWGFLSGLWRALEIALAHRADERIRVSAGPGLYLAMAASLAAAGTAGWVGVFRLFDRTRMIEPLITGPRS